MPAILTHDFFGRDFLSVNPKVVAATKDAREAFLLGNQGPDPLFYLEFVPGTGEWRALGNRMHDQRPTHLIAAFLQAAECFQGEDRDLAQAYTLGLVCHYTLDSTAHPFVYAFEKAVMDAGIEGIGLHDAGFVHLEIERECDECMLYRKKGRTIEDYKPYKEALRGSGHMLAVVGKLYAYACADAFGVEVPDDLFPKAVAGFRATQRALYAPKDGKRQLAHTVVRASGGTHSRFDVMAHRVYIGDACPLDNHEHLMWANPFSGAVSTNSFYDCVDAAFCKAKENVEAVQAFWRANAEGAGDAPVAVPLQTARAITGGLNFSGQPAQD